MNLRAAQSSDAKAIAQLWNHYIKHSIATFNSKEKTTLEVVELIKSDHFIVALDENDTLRGFVTYHQFRGGIGYAHSAEHTIYIDPNSPKSGLGQELMRACEASAKSDGFHTLIAGISAENLIGLAFHTKIGFENQITLREVGRKFDRWHDLVFMQKIL